MPTQHFRRSRRILWSTVSKAALRLSKIKPAHFPESTVSNKSLATLRRPDSVLWCYLKADWNFSEMLFLVKNEESWEKITFSKTFERKDSWEIGLKLIVDVVQVKCSTQSFKRNRTCTYLQGKVVKIKVQ